MLTKRFCLILILIAISTIVYANRMTSYVEEIDNKGYGHVVHTDNNEERTAHTVAVASKSKSQKKTSYIEYGMMTPDNLDSTGVINTGDYKVTSRHHPEGSMEGRYEGAGARGIGLSDRVPLCPKRFELEATARCTPDRDDQAGTVTATM